MAIFDTFDDLVPNYKFHVEIPGFGSINFMEVDGLGFTSDVQKVRPGGHVVSTELYLGTTYTDITLRRGMSNSAQLWDFSQHPMRMFDSLPKAAPYTGQNANEMSGFQLVDFRTDIIIKQLDNSGKVVKQWKVYEAWVKEYKVNALSADRSEVSVESITLSHSGFILEDPAKFTGVGDIFK